MNKLHLLVTTAALLFSACADFPEKYENVIEDEKIRPFAIVLEPAEAAPGDTVGVMLHLYDAGKTYTVDWTLQLDYSVDNYAILTNTGFSLDLDSMNIPATAAGADDRLQFRFVVPDGGLNPMFLSPLVPEILIPAEEFSAKQTDNFEALGITIGNKGLTSRALVEYFESQDEIPGALAPLVDEMISLIRLNAKVKTSEFELDVVKKLTVRYSNRLEQTGMTKNVNQNPGLDSIGIIAVDKEGLTDPDDISEFEADTQYFSINAYNFDGNTNPVIDTFVIKEKYSYFLVADSAGAAQKYLSPDGKEHVEQLFYQWFYTNLDKTGSEWEDLIEIGADGADASLPVVYLKIPADKNMRNFIIRTTVGDWRPEWAMLATAGLTYLEVRGYFQYE